MSELKPCPFCGSTKLKTESKSKLYGYTGLDYRIERHTYSVRCNVCHARGGAVGGLVAPGFHINDRDRLPKDIEFPHELIQKAHDLWNKRGKEEKWIIGDGEDNFDVKCPVCGWTDVFEVCGIHMVKDIASEMHYCQHCGSKMSV